MGWINADKKWNNYILVKVKKETERVDAVVPIWGVTWIKALCIKAQACAIVLIYSNPSRIVSKGQLNGSHANCNDKETIKWFGSQRVEIFGNTVTR